MVPSVDPDSAARRRQRFDRDRRVLTSMAEDIAVPDPAQRAELIQLEADIGWTPPARPAVLRCAW